MSQYNDQVENQAQFSSPPAYHTPIVYPEVQLPAEAPGVSWDAAALGQAYPTPIVYPQVQLPAEAPGVESLNTAALGQAYRDQLFAQCALGNHQRTTTYGICGIITAVALFPIGLICLFYDSEQKCSRCGVLLK